MNTTPSNLSHIARQLAAPGKGILAADESNATLTKRFNALGIDSTPENRCAYRTMLFSDTEAMRSYISGVILFDETIRQTSAAGVPLTQMIQDTGALVGIKVDTGLSKLLNSDIEKITNGLEGLETRLQEYKKMGATFTKWRATFSIDTEKELPSKLCIEANAELLAHYAAIVQSQGMVPIVEPEVLMDGTHTAETCYAVTTRVLRKVIKKLWLFNVDLSGIILKPNMIVAGTECSSPASPQDVASRTRACLTHILPPAIPGVLFLSGGQSDVEATEHLHLMNTMDQTPWALSFSYGRALQSSALKAWASDITQTQDAQRIFRHRAHMNSLASMGKWDKGKE